MSEQVVPHISYSQFSTYVDCGEKFRLTRVIGIQEDPAYWFAGGTAVHTATEVVDHALFEEYGR
jgi:hypothetical protein